MVSQGEHFLEGPLATICKDKFVPEFKNPKTTNQVVPPAV